MTPNIFPDSSQGDSSDNLPDDLRALEADLRLLQPREYQAAADQPATPPTPIGSMRMANASGAIFAAGILLGFVLGGALTHYFWSRNPPVGPAVAQLSMQPGPVEEPIANRETSPTIVDPDESQVASLSLMGIAQFFSQSAENDDRQVALPPTDRLCSASPQSWESFLFDEMPPSKFRFAKSAAFPRHTALDLQKELLNSF